MSILLKVTGANGVSPVLDAHSCGKDFVKIRATALGNFAADIVKLQHSPDSGLNWIDLGTFAAAKDEVIVDPPFDWLRAIGGPAMTGTCNVYIDPSA